MTSAPPSWVDEELLPQAISNEMSKKAARRTGERIEFSGKVRIFPKVQNTSSFRTQESLQFESAMRSAMTPPSIENCALIDTLAISAESIMPLMHEL